MAREPLGEEKVTDAARKCESRPLQQAFRLVKPAFLLTFYFPRLIPANYHGSIIGLGLLGGGLGLHPILFA